MSSSTPLKATISPTVDASDRLAGWSPCSGEATSALLQRQALSDEQQASVREQALRILARCGDPANTGPRRYAHLAVGEVQSGKTLSFTTAIALARDNDFPLVIVLAGTKKNLLGQTVKRFSSDLGENEGRAPAFRTFVTGEYELSDLRTALRAAADRTIPKPHRATVVIFVLKHTGRLGALASDLRTVIPEAGHMPTLVIDDEADQAGMNIAPTGRESAVYSAIADLRRAIPRNDVLMYTATPQAPLLMSVADEWSPYTVAVLRSGEGYVGGQQLFVDGREDFVRVIPDQELPIALDPAAVEPPASLRKAILVYLLALAATQKTGAVRPLSMLIHPASAKNLHEKYNTWTRAIVDSVHRAVSSPGDVTAKDLAAELKPLYVDLVRTSGERLFSLEEAMEEIRYLIPALAIKIVNSGHPDEIAPEDWGRGPGWILIGGNKLDRGFTVENLAVTYMPRGTGQGSADTIQQRGRFFGYKAKYAGYLRGWFNADTADAFEAYVTHERSVLAGLKEVEQESTPLRTWKRKFLLDAKYKPTRSNADRLEPTTWAPLSRNGWYVQRQLHDVDAAADNVQTFLQFLKVAGELSPEVADDRTGPRHLGADIPIDTALELLSEWRAVGADAHRLSALELALASDTKLQKLTEARVIVMDGYRDLSDATQRRTRSLNAKGETPLLQGRSPNGSYVGDALIFDPNRVTIQLHLLSLADKDKNVVVDPAAAIAVHIDRAPTLYLQD